MAPSPVSATSCKILSFSGYDALIATSLGIKKISTTHSSAMDVVCPRQAITPQEVKPPGHQRHPPYNTCHDHTTAPDHINKKMIAATRSHSITDHIKHTPRRPSHQILWSLPAAHHKPTHSPDTRYPDPTCKKSTSLLVEWPHTFKMQHLGRLSYQDISTCTDDRPHLDTKKRLIHYHQTQEISPRYGIPSEEITTRISR